MDPLGALEEEEWVLVVPDGVEDDGDVAVTGGHLGMILTEHQQKQVASPALGEEKLMIKSKLNGDIASDNLVAKTTNIIKLTLIIIIRKQQLKISSSLHRLQGIFFYHKFWRTR